MLAFKHRMWIWLKTMYLRVTLNKITTAFFLFSFAHCFVHSIVQSFIYTIDANANALASDIVDAAQVPADQLAWLVRPDGRFILRMCKAIPFGKRVSPCVDVFDSEAQKLDVPAGFKRSPQGSDIATAIADAPAPPSTGRTFVRNGAGDFFLEPVPDAAGNITGLDFQFASGNARSVFLDEQCTRVLVYAEQVLENAKREELALIGSEFWLFGISLFAIMYDSIPHLLAGLFMRVLSAGWSAYAIWRTQDIQLRFRVLVTQGACGVDLFPDYMKQRMAFQIPDLVLNLVALLLSCFLVWRLARTYASFMFTRVGAPPNVVKIYRFFLGVFICMQLLSYLFVTSAALWVDQLLNGAIARISSFTPIYLALFIFTNIVLLPWISMGWFAVRREMRRTMAAFLVLGFIFLACWAIMYYSMVFRWTWLQWPYFASLTVAAQLVLVATIILGVLSWRHFDEGLKQFLHIDDVLTKADFEPEVFEHSAAQAPRISSSTTRTSSSSGSSEEDVEKAGDLAPSGKAARLSLDFGARQPVPRTYVVPSLMKNDPWATAQAGKGKEAAHGQERPPSFYAVDEDERDDLRVAAL